MENRTYTERLDHRPGSQSKGVLNEDLGSSFDLPKRPFPGMAILDSEDDDDELDGLSKKKKKDAPSSPSTMPRVHRDTDDVIRGMKFNKIKKADTDTESPIPTLKENARRDTDKKFTSTVAIHERKNAVASSSTDPRRDKASNRLRSPEGARAKRTAHLMQQRNGTDGSSAKPQRPKPRAVVKQAKAPPMSTQSPSTPKPKPPSRDVATSAKSKGKEKERPANRFPALSPLGDAGGSVNGKERPAKASRAYPGPSPLSSPAKAPTRFPLPSPLSTPTRNRNGQPLVATRYPVPSPLRPEVEGRRKTKRAEPRPFPMNTQLSELSPGPSKRRSPASDSDEERDRKRYKNQPALLPESYDYEEDSELLFISPGTDPKTLCPYCDTPLPPQPTPLLARLLDQTFNKSYRDVRPSNPLGRKAPMGVFVAVCQRHRFESETLPEAEERGWPKCIDWAGLKGRVLKMKRDLSHILTDPGDPIVYRNDDEKEKTQDDETKPHRSKGPRMRCIFWKDLLKDLKNNGTKGVKGVQGQFANFEKTQPG
ncbi:hypothetical protein C8R44DRAFT_134087 [Mycena epipterygia]|nr:hypothetical protein C8R44DRAFT_134087 [Mycena epipterygia]